jgi:hypothetical protein
VKRSGDQTMYEQHRWHPLGKLYSYSRPVSWRLVGLDLEGTLCRGNMPWRYDPPSSPRCSAIVQSGKPSAGQPL